MLTELAHLIAVAKGDEPADLGLVDVNEFKLIE